MTHVACSRHLRLAKIVLMAFTLTMAGAGSVAVAGTKDDAGVLRATLANGLRVVIVRNTLAPVVSTSVNYLVGSDETPKGFPGTAHAQEHMMFRGSPGLTADQLANIGSVMGGDFNANTRESITQYLYTVPSEDLDVALHIEAIRMQGVDDSEKDWDKERGAIEQEVAQDISIPGYKMYEQLRAEMFAGTPYEHDALGTRPSFDKTTAKMLQDFHDTWYAPNNAILVVVGDLDPQKTLAEIKQLFGPIKAKKLPARPVVNFKPVPAKSFTVDTDSPNETQIIALRLPGLQSPDFPALEVLADVLASHRFDLYGLVAEGKALGADFSIEPLPKAGIGYAEVSFSPGGDAKAIEQEMRSILAKVAKSGVSPELVEAAKLQERRDAAQEKDSIAGLASVWSDAVALYGLKSPDEDLARIEKVTVADVNRVARKYLRLDHAISALMLPQGSGRPVASGGGFGGQETISLGEAKSTDLPDWAEAALKRLTVPKSTVHPVVTTLANGLTLIVQPEDVSDTVSVFGRIRNRAETEEPVGKEGVSLLLGPLLTFGTEHLDRMAYQKALDQIGASERAGTDFSIEMLSQNFDRGVELLADNELHPALPAQAMELIKPQIANAVAARNKSPGWLAQRTLTAALFPATDPSLRQATAETVNALTPDDVRAYYNKVFRPDLTTIVVIGNITPEKARASIEKYFGGWTAVGPKPETDLPTAPANHAADLSVPDASRVQDNVVLAYNLALTRSDPDYYALSLGNAVLGGGFYSTRLSIDLRKNAGLVYSVGAGLEAGRTRGVYYVEYACDPDNVTKAAKIVAQELKNMQTAPVTADELTRVKALMLRQIPLGEASISDIASGFLQDRELNLPLDESTIAAQRYVAIDPAEIEAAFQKWMRPDDLVRVTQGPPPQ
ncbi:MAG: insulinase family protein [Alphaproteobacteria bacterium]|nr:insulinase family protein [Alphaproteobacteria bacterium]MDE2162754.1 insulinase family protein [Alphaproteobacteria bacterium]MDE2265170.1 insulinase family protein [Alphaproteobacteria bacterium]MDE2498691.1 insulinase family protein [Alphaproteobacteria bacterium]